MEASGAIRLATALIGEVLADRMDEDAVLRVNVELKLLDPSFMSSVEVAALRSRAHSGARSLVGGHWLVPVGNGLRKGRPEDAAGAIVQNGLPADHVRHKGSLAQRGGQPGRAAAREDDQLEASREDVRLHRVDERIDGHGLRPAARADKSKDWLCLQHGVPVPWAAPDLAPNQQAAELRDADIALDLGVGSAAKGGLNCGCFRFHASEMKLARGWLRLGGDQNFGDGGARIDGHADGSGWQRWHAYDAGMKSLSASLWRARRKARSAVTAEEKGTHTHASESRRTSGASGTLLSRQVWMTDCPSKGAKTVSHFPGT